MNTPERRICRTVEETRQAGWDDGEHDAGMTSEEITRIAALLAPHLKLSEPDQAA